MPFLLACDLVRGSPFLRTVDNIVYRPMRKCGLDESSVMIYDTTHLFPSTAIKCIKYKQATARMRATRQTLRNWLDARGPPRTYGQLEGELVSPLLAS